MKKQDFLVFYINISNINPNQLDYYLNDIQRTAKVDGWFSMFIPIYNGETRLQVVRVNHQDELNDITLKEFIDKSVELKYNERIKNIQDLNEHIDYTLESKLKKIQEYFDLPWWDRLFAEKPEI